MANVYNEGKLILTDGTVVWDGAEDFGVLLVTSSYTYDADHVDVADVTNELSGGGYARQTALGGRTITKNNTTNRVEYDATDETFPSLDIAAGQPVAAVIFNNTPAADADKQLIAYVSLTAPPVPNGGDYTIQWDAVGAFYLGD